MDSMEVEAKDSDNVEYLMGCVGTWHVLVEVRGTLPSLVRSTVGHRVAPRDSKEGRRLLPPMGEKALNRARENEVGDSAGGCVCPQRRAHSRYLAFRQDYVFSVRRVSLAAEQVSCATTFQMVSFPGSSWATNGHYPARVSPGVVPSRVSRWLV
ncbi:hypothetical protein LguiB_008616 [Lonicera macranthoides]